MRRTVKLWVCQPSKRLLISLLSLALGSLALLKLPLFHTDPKPVEVPVDAIYREHIHSYVKEILAKECRPSFARQRMEAEHHSSIPVVEPFLDKNSHLNDKIFQYPPPFGFMDLKNKLQEILNLLPASSEVGRGGRDCRRCVVIGNGGILKGLGLGHLLNQFNVIISSFESLLTLTSERGELPLPSEVGSDRASVSAHLSLALLIQLCHIHRPPCFGVHCSISLTPFRHGR
ncbi:Lactosylceramide alpha-2,3-sialyltransferase [Anabarilius grahami]|uniref:Lactosylceramide alpha-2,3-sialyltransferase n=1 Tax=Anabarilius grahami TaxID=495550 RepID=A0A3N0XD97_ANAGA|nr:Lactosylceramide alpha-2,3-sialyltransferase [Anabarilius grahami]